MHILIICANEDRLDMRHGHVSHFSARTNQ